MRGENEFVNAPGFFASTFRKPWFLVGVFTAVIAHPLWLDSAALPIRGDLGDAYQHFSFSYSLVDAIRNHGELPLWNPYFGGGIPWAGHPINAGVSPITLVYALAGDVAGPKWVGFLFLLLAGWGVGFSCRAWFALNDSAAVVAALLYVSGLWTLGRIADGNYSELSLMLLPVALALQYLVIQRHFAGLLLPLLYLSVVAESRTAPLVFAPVLVLVPILSGVDLGAHRLRTVLSVWLVPLLFAAGMSLAKLLPLLEMLELNQAELFADRDVRYAGVGALLRAMVGLDPAALKSVVGLGPVACGLAALGVASYPRRTRPVLLCALIAAFVAVDTFESVANLQALIPVLNSTRHFLKYWNVHFLFAGAVLAGFGIAKLTEWAGRDRRRRSLVIALAASAVLPPAVTTLAGYRSLFAGGHARHARLPFHHMGIAGSDLGGRFRGDGWLQYRNIRSHVGTLTWYGAFRFPEAPRPAYTVALRSNSGTPTRPGAVAEFLRRVDCDSLAERDLCRAFARDRVVDVTAQGAPSAYSAPGCDVRDFAFSYNTLRFSLDPRHCSEVRLHFNYSRHWTSSSGRLSEVEGLLALQPDPAGADAGGRVEVTLRYAPSRFFIGLACSGVFLSVWLVGYSVWVRRFNAPRGIAVDG
jgi:hypothetical protein